MVGLAFEQEAPNAAVANQMVKNFVQENGIPYPCAVGDESILAKIPNFHAFPTTIVIDRQGRMRLLALDNSEGLINALDNTVIFLAGESATPATTAAKPSTTAPTTTATKKAESKPAPAPATAPVPPAAAKNAAKPK